MPEPLSPDGAQWATGDPALPLTLPSQGRAGRSHGSPTLAAADTLDRIRGEYALRRFGEAQLLLDRLETILDAVPWASVEEPLQNLLRASATCMRGRIARRTPDRHQEALSCFAAASGLFKSYQAEIHQQPLKLRFYTDYGIALFWLDRFPEAVDTLGLALEEGVAAAETYAYFGVANDRLGHYEQAERAIRQGLALAPGDVMLLLSLAGILRRFPARQYEAVRAYYQAAEIARQSGDLEKIKTALQQALDLDPTDSDALEAAVDLARSQSLPIDAEACVDRALSVNSAHTLAKGLKAILRRDDGDLETAVALFQQLRDLPPELAWLYVEHGRTLMQIGPRHSEDVIELARRAFALNPLAADALLLQAQALPVTERQQALSLVALATRLDPDFVDAWIALARAHAELGETDEALEAFDRAIGLTPNSPEARLRKIDLLKHIGDVDGCIDELRLAVQAHPGDFAILSRLVDELMAANFEDEALWELEQQVIENPGHWQAHRKRGLVLVGRDRLDDAVAALRRAVELRPGEVDIHLELGDALAARGELSASRNDLHDAGEAFDRALALAPLHPGGLVRKVLWLCHRALYVDARSLAELLVEQQPDDSRLAILLGQVLLFAGAPPGDCESTFQRSLDLEPEDILANLVFAAFLMDHFQREKGATFACKVIESYEKQESSAYSQELLPALSWARYLLRSPDEALRLIQAWIASTPDDIPAHFDRALILLVSGRGVAYADYNQLIAQVREINPLRQPGTLAVALRDLIAAVANKRLTEGGAEKVFDTLIAALEQTDADRRQLPWLGPTLADCVELLFNRDAAPRARRMLLEDDAVSAIQLLENECSALAGAQRWLILARGYKQLGNDDAALVTIYSGIDKLGRRADLLVALATVLARQGRNAEALIELEQADEIAPKSDLQLQLRMAVVHLGFLHGIDAGRIAALEELADDYALLGLPVDGAQLEQASRELTAMRGRLRTSLSLSAAPNDASSPVPGLSDFVSSFGQRQRDAGTIEQTHL